MHLLWSILCGVFFAPVIAPEGQARRHAPQALHFSSLIEYVSSALQTFAGHFLSLICASYSSRKYLIVLRIGFGAVCPRPQSDVALIPALSFSSRSISLLLPWPFVIRSSVSSSRLVPTRQGTHLPQDSDWVNWTKYRATFTMQSSSSSTIMPPEPTIEPSFASDS